MIKIHLTCIRSLLGSFLGFAGLALAISTTHGATVDFENLSAGDTGSQVYDDPAGYTFVSGDGNGTLYVSDNGYPGNVLTNQNWNQSITITKTAGGTFGLDAFDHASRQAGKLADATVTATFADSSTSSVTVSSSTMSPATETLNWANLISVKIDWTGGSTGRYGVIDNVQFTPEIILTSEQIAARFLTQASFGPTYAEIQALATDIDTNGEPAALEAWIDAEFAKSHNTLWDRFVADTGSTSVSAWGFPKHWYTQAVYADDQLRQRLNYALSQIYVISSVTFVHPGEDFFGYYDMLGSNAFGNFRDLLYDVSLHPMMGKYLSHLKNAKADPVANTNPDENYAREIMQLFSIGLFELNQDGARKTDGNGDDIPTYGNEEITEFARVFTGFSTIDGGFSGGSNFVDPMKMYDDYHDFGAKQLLDYPAGPNNPAAANGGAIAAQTDNGGVEEEGLNDINFAIDNLFNHPNTGPFIARLLIQQLVTSNPTAGYIQRVADAFAGNSSYGSTRGDMKAVIKAILLDDEARDAGMLTDPEHGKLNDSILRFTQILRALDVYNTDTSITFLHLKPLKGDLGMDPMASPSVFNFFLPDFQPPGPVLDAGLFAPEFEVVTDAVAVATANHWKSTLEGKVGQLNYLNAGYSTYDFTDLVDVVSTSGHAALVDRVDLLFCRGLMSQNLHDAIVTAVDDIDTLPDVEKVQLAVYLAAYSPESAILR